MSDHFRLKVRMVDDRKFSFIRSDGYSTSLRIHAATWDNSKEAIHNADFVLNGNEKVEAVRVVDENGKLIYKAGAELPPKKQFPFHEYKYLRSISNNRGTFEVKDNDGRWGHVTSDIYNECYYEAKRAGIRTDSFTVRGSICTIVTKGLTFSQQRNQWQGDNS